MDKKIKQQCETCRWFFQKQHELSHKTHFYCTWLDSHNVPYFLFGKVSSLRVLGEVRILGMACKTWEHKI